MPGGYTATKAKEYLSKERHLGPGLTESVLLQAVVMQPSGRLGSEDEATAFLDKVCDAYGSANGVTIPKGPLGGGGGGGGMMMPMMMGGGGATYDDSALKQLFADQIDAMREQLLHRQMQQRLDLNTFVVEPGRACNRRLYC